MWPDEGTWYDDEDDDEPINRKPGPLTILILLLLVLAMLATLLWPLLPVRRIYTYPTATPKPAIWQEA